MSKRKQKLDARTLDFLQAVTRGDLEVATAALQAGVDPNAKDAHGVPALCLACMGAGDIIVDGRYIDPHKSIIGMAQLLLHHGADADAAGESLLQIAVCRPDLKLAAMLLDAGADPNMRYSDGETALHSAVTNDCPELVEFLLKHGANPELADKGGKTPLTLASEKKGDHACYELLRAERLRKSPAITPPPIDTKALNELLVKAVEAGSARVAAACLDEGADINTQDAYKNSLLHSAAFDGRNSVVALLLARGVPVDLASAKHDGDTPLIWAAEAGHVSTVRLLLSKGANPNVYGAEDYGPLHRAAFNNYVDVAEALCDAGAEVSSNTEIGTPLHVACRKGHIEMAHFLLERGADPFIQDIDDRTPRDWCKSHHRLTELLKRAEDARVHSAGHKPQQRPK